MSFAAGPMPPVLMSGIAIILSPTGTAMFFDVVRNWNWNVRSSPRVTVVVDVDFVDRLLGRG